MKKLPRIIIGLSIGVSLLSTSIYANSLPKEIINLQSEKSDVSQLFVNFMDNIFSDLEGLYITDSNGVDVTKGYINKVTMYYSVKDYASIQQLIQNNDLSVSHRVKTIVNTSNDATIAASRTEYFSQEFYHLRADSQNKFPAKEWLTKVSGSAVVEPNTGKIISSSQPTLSLTVANFGSQFAPSMNNVVTRSSISGSKITFSGSYKMVAVITIPIGNLGIGVKLDYGSHTDSFKVTPEF